MLASRFDSEICVKSNSRRNADALTAGPARHPLPQVDRAGTAAQLKIQPRLLLPATVTNRRNDVSRCHPVAGALENRFVVTIQRHEPLAVINNHYEAHAREPIGKRDATMINSAHFLSTWRSQHNAIPLELATNARLPKIV